MPLSLTEQTLQCVDCDATFPFTTAEQRFYAERGLVQPSRCPACRAKRRAERNAEAIKASEGGQSGVLLWSDGYGSFGGAAGGGKRGRAGTQMYAAVCSSCGRATEVPFEPRGGRPVYCRDCFNARRGR